MIRLIWVAKASGVFLLWAMAAIALPAQTYNVIYSFCPTTKCPEGGYPYAALVQGTDGKLYGTNYQGGTDTKDCLLVISCGTVFSITTSGALQNLHSFHNYPDGYHPFAGLVQGTDGKFYGTTASGGAMKSKQCNPLSGCGTVFSITADGTLTTVHSFDDTDGAGPTGTLVQGTDGKFYGTTTGGGAYVNNECPSGCGTVFSITADGALTTLHSFDCSIDGCGPVGGMAQGMDGKFYGTTFTGGALYEIGTAFSITLGGTLTTLINFDNINGEAPEGGLIQGTDGEFYGTTTYGGERGSGTVFSVTDSTTLAALASFDLTDGSLPYAGLVQGTDGNFYGTAYVGGNNYGGTIFKITPTGVLTSLHSFCALPNCTDGIGPTGGLVQDTDGKFYGATVGGGANDAGVVFSLSVGLGPFVKTLPTTASVGASVFILGTDLTGATKVTFNGTAATFTVASPSKITTTVPAGATSGTVQVVTPGGTLNSNIPFTVE